MFCTKCGSQQADGTRFCTVCGNQLAVPVAPVAPVAPEIPEAPVAPAAPEAPVAPVAPVAPTYVPPTYVPPTYVPPAYTAPAPVAPAPARLPDTPVGRLKKSAGSVLSLIATIVFSLLVTVQLFTAFDGLGSTAYYIGVGSVGQIFGGLSSFASLIALIPTILMLVGLWINYGTAKKMDSTNGTGLTMVKIAMILRLVGKFLALLVVIAGVVMLFVALDSIPGAMAEFENALGVDYVMGLTLLGAVVAIIGVGMLLPILYDFFVLSVTNGMKKTLSTDTACLNGCGRLSVMNYVMMALQVLGLLWDLALGSVTYALVDLLPGDYSYTVMSLLGGSDAGIFVRLLMITLLILFAIILSSYKKAEKAAASAAIVPETVEMN